MLPLQGIVVLSLAHQYPGPFATMQLSDLGADVVVVERPDGGDPTREFPSFHGALARGKRSVALDLKSAAGKSVMARLVAEADVLMEGFRPGTMKSLGFGHERMRELHPQLVYVSISGYGQSGPLRDMPGHDITYQAEAGMLYSHLPPAPPPPPPPIAWADLSAGMFAAQAVVTALLRRERNGGDGCYVDVSMHDCLIAMLAAHVGPTVNGTGQAGFPYEPGYGVFVTGDGRYIALGVAHEDHFWRRLCDVLGLDEVRELRSAERFERGDELRDQLSEAIATNDSKTLDSLLAAADLPYGWLRELGELPTLPHARERSMFVRPYGMHRYVRQPLVIDGETPGPHRGPPRLGQHTTEVLKERGVDDREIAELISTGVAFQDPGHPGHPGPKPRTSTDLSSKGTR
jgi:crotonobetainyl-CoA:carnitine CoA-transferase CaiB-like acyl-CoA transferase